MDPKGPTYSAAVPFSGDDTAHLRLLGNLSLVEGDALIKFVQEAAKAREATKTRAAARAKHDRNQAEVVGDEEAPVDNGRCQPRSGKAFGWKN